MSVSGIRGRQLDQDECGICLSKYEQNVSNDCLRLKCGHIFHHACVERWILKKKSCPTCRSYSVIILVPIRKIFNQARKNFIPICISIAIFIAAPIFTITIMSMATRAYHNLPLLITPEEMTKQAQEYTLKTGYKVIQVSMKSFYFYSLVVVPIVLALSFVITVFVTNYVKSRVKMTMSKAERINYIYKFKASTI
ncbi:MAG: hypothetical protein H0X51_00740 [Parachlamydiaceae bacterium]|nr:hypothetical protein [Parachlamydiaceae bacterium]